MRTIGSLMGILAVASLVSAGLSAADPKAGSSPALTPTQRLVAQTPDVSLAKVALETVFEQYSSTSGLTIQPDWPSLEAVGVTKQTPVSLRTRKLTFDKLLDLTLDSIAPKGHPLAWRLTDSTIAVSTQMRILLASRSARVEPAAGARRESAGRPRQIDFDNTPLHLALGFLKDMADVNMHVNWRALEMTGISKDTPITVKVTNVSIARAMDLVLNQLNAGRDKLSSVYWVIDAGVVEVSTGESLNTDTRVRVFDIGDLLVVAPNFQGPRISLDSSDNNSSGNNGSSGASLFANYSSSGNNGSTGGSEEGESITVQREKIRDTLIQTIRESIGDDMWAPIGKGSISVMRNKLLISQTTLGFKLLEKVIGPG